MHTASCMDATTPREEAKKGGEERRGDERSVEKNREVERRKEEKRRFTSTLLD